MSDEYASSGFQGSLVNNSMEAREIDQAQRSSDYDYQTGNYPSDGDSTASGGYGSSTNVWSAAAQRGRISVGDEKNNDNSNNSNSNRGLIDQSLSGGPIGYEIQDAKQGVDERARETFGREVKRDFGHESGLNPYGRSPDSRKEAEDMLVQGFRESRDG